MEKTHGTKNSVANVAKIKPPITARPRGAFCSPPSPRPTAIGTMPMIMARAVMSTGRMRTKPASIAASRAFLPSSICSRANETIKMLLAVATPMHMIAPGKEGPFNGGGGSSSGQAKPRKGAGQCRNNDEGIKPRLEVHDNQQVCEHDGPKQSNGETCEGTLHGLDLTASDDVAAFWQILFNGLHTLFHFVSDAAEVAAFH